MDNLDRRYIYRASIRTRNGKRIFAWQYGLKAFRIKVRHSLPPSQPNLPGIV
jgi:hypothetical protein